MPKTVTRTVNIWHQGQAESFAIYNCGVALDQLQYQQAGGAYARKQKNQIVLHYTAGNGPGSGTVGWWNTMAQFLSNRVYCPRYLNGHAYDAAAPAAGAPPIPCPEGHGNLKKMANRASAHYVVERANHRQNPAQAYVDVVEVVESDAVTWHGEIVNENSIGIEHANVGWDWNASADSPTTGAGANERPTDHNKWLHLATPARPDSNLAHNDFQAYQEEQYRGMILLLRFLCIKHRIPRRFLGDTTDEKMARWWHNRDVLTRSKLMRFRGILSHMNCHDGKECGGPALHRNRLFRGIIDEWWLPVEVAGAERHYYMGPFDPQTGQASHFRWDAGVWAGVTFHDADLDALQETKSYYDLDKTSVYYAATESLTVGGTYPVGINKIWHGGIHFAPPASNLQVYAAASGRIVAARLGSDATVEADSHWGSQRFVLIRHTVYWRQEADPGGGQRMNFTADPTYFFSLYMHLASVPSIDAVNDSNPPWFNYWLRRRPAGADPNRVFCPNVPVSVGDWLGTCGTYRTQRMLHFEIISREEMIVAPWDDANKRIFDSDANMICDDAKVARFIRTVAGQAVQSLDVLRAARDLRAVKSYHKSNWSLSDSASLTPVVPNAADRTRTWASLRHFMWWADAIAALPELSTQLADASGLVWHYHPVTFMDFINNLILRENAQVSEPDFRETNVTMEGEFLGRYVSFATGTAVDAAADNQAVKPFSVSVGTFEYHFTRRDLACNLPAPHDPPNNPPHGTHFHISLLDILEDIREDYEKSIVIALSHVCPAHNVAANAASCMLGHASGLNSHATGLAVDIRPAAPNRAKCRELLQAAKDAADRFRATCGEHSGEPSRGDLLGHAQDVLVLTQTGIETKLTAGTATAAEITAFTIHLEILERTVHAYWVCWLRSGTLATDVRLEGARIVGAFPNAATANSQREPGTAPAHPSGAQWEAIIKSNTKAVRVELRPPGIVGFFENAVDANDEKVMDQPWLEERSTP